jgi:biopolymer transport protein ExbB
MDNLFDIVDLVLYLLTALSVLTWAILLYKLYVFNRLKRLNKQYLDKVKNLSRITQLPIPDSQKPAQGPLSYLTHTLFYHLKHWNNDPNLQVPIYTELLQQALNDAQHELRSKLESGLSILATIGSTAPFIGLFGTVWGIMHALKGISATGSAGLDVVAGPIGEALIATAMGIAAAIPAVLAYNFLLNQVRLAETDMTHFSARLQTIAKRADYQLKQWR